MASPARLPVPPAIRRSWAGLLALSLPAAALVPIARSEPWAPETLPLAPFSGRPEPAPPAATPAEALALERVRRTAAADATQGRHRYLQAAHDLLQRFWQTRNQPRLLLPGDRATGCGRPEVRHPMAFYCAESRELAMALNLRRSVRTARNRSATELLLLDLAVLAHEWGHHVNREQGLGPYRGGLGLTVKQEELAADWRTGVFIGWLLRHAAISVDDYTQTANLLFEMGDYERISRQHHGYPRDRIAALSRGVATQIRAGQQLGSWTVDTAETFSRPRPPQEPLATGAWTREYEVRRFEIDRSQQIATNVVGGLLGAATCLLGSSEQCMGMALQQGRGRASGSYNLRRLSLDCSARLFDVSDDPFGPQPIERDGKGQATVLAKRDCPDLRASAGAT